MRKMIAAAVLALAALTLASPAYADPASYRLSKLVVREPGTLRITFTDSHEVYDVFAIAESRDQSQVNATQQIHRHGHVFTLYMKFRRGMKTGDWYFDGVYATRVGHKFNPYAGPVTNTVTVFRVRS